MGRESDLLSTKNGNRCLGNRVKSSHKVRGGVVFHHMKALGGRGRDAAHWVIEVHKELLSDFE